MLKTKDIKHIKLVFFAGYSEEEGRPIFRTRSYKNVNSENVTLEKVNAFGKAMGALSEWPLNSVILSTDTEIFEIDM